MFLLIVVICIIVIITREAECKFNPFGLYHLKRPKDCQSLGIICGPIVGKCKEKILLG